MTSIKNIFFGLLGLTFLMFSVNVSAGGTIAAGWGNGIYLPRSDDQVTWSAYGAPLTAHMRDVLALATATLDAETDGFRLLHDFHPELSNQHVWFSFIGGDPSSKCNDGIPGGCTLGVNQCLKYDIVGPYKLCTESKIKIYVANIEVSAEANGQTFDELLHGVVRHEWTHSLGFEDGVGGPSDGGRFPFTECQLAQLRTYNHDASTEVWTVVNPPECQ